MNRGRGRGQLSAGFGPTGRGGRSDFMGRSEPARGGGNAQFASRGRGSDFGGRGGRGADAGGRGGGRGPAPDFGPSNPQEGILAMLTALRGLLISATPKPYDGRPLVRPNFGSAGRASTVHTNHFVLGTARLQHLVHYDVSVQRFKPGAVQGSGHSARLSSGLLRTVIARLAREQGWPPVAYDGERALFTVAPFASQPSTQLVVALPEEDGRPGDRIFQVTVRLVGVTDAAAVLSGYRQAGSGQGASVVLRALEAAVRQSVLSRPGCVAAGDAIFIIDGQNAELRLGRGLEAWRGYSLQVRQVQAGVTLTLDLVYRAFVAGRSLLEVVAELLGLGGTADLAPLQLSAAQHRMLAKLLAGLRVARWVGTARRHHRIVGLTDQPASSASFTPSGGGPPVTVAAHFEKQLGEALRVPQLPCLDVSPPDSGPPGLQQRSIWLPMEVCSVRPGQARWSPDEGQCARMAALAATKPFNRRPELERAHATTRFAVDATLSAMGVQVSTQMLQAHCRILPQPRLAYGEPECFDVGTQGAWNLKSLLLPRPVTLACWAVICLAPLEEAEPEGSSALSVFLQDQIKLLNDVGVMTPGLSVGVLPPVLSLRAGQDVTWHMQRGKEMAEEAAALRSGVDAPAAPQRCQLLVVVVPTRDAGVYAEVKRAGDGLLGVPSQVVVMRHAGVGTGTAPKGRLQYCTSLALKVNAKLGGINARLAGDPAQVIPVIGSRLFMIIGVDVAQPALSDAGSCSPVAAVVASVDRGAVRYTCRIAAQPRTRTRGGASGAIANLKQMLKEVMKDFYMRNERRRPEALLLYRSGVSAGAADAVAKQEVEAVHAACADMGDPTWRPPVTYVLVRRRHHTRLFPPDAAADRTGNALAGTVLDRDVCHPLLFDFYLNSHAGLKGTSRPSHYTVLADEIGFGADALQILTYWLCYLQARCMRSSCVCPPVQYARMAAQRGRIMMTQPGGPAGGLPAATPGAAAQHPNGAANGNGAVPQVISVHRELLSSMFYL